MKTTIDIRMSDIAIINRLLKLEGATNTTPILYKKTAKEFKRKFGVDLQNAPMVFTAHECMWKLSHMTYTFRGRVYEKADYLPIVGCRGFFTRMDRTDIYNRMN